MVNTEVTVARKKARRRAKAARRIIMILMAIIIAILVGVVVLVSYKANQTIEILEKTVDAQSTYINSLPQYETSTVEYRVQWGDSLSVVMEKFYHDSSYHNREYWRSYNSYKSAFVQTAGLYSEYSDIENGQLLTIPVAEYSK